VADPGHDLPAVASGAAKTQVARFQHDDVGDAFFRQFKGCVDAGKAAADDHHVGVYVLFEARETEVVFLGGRVIGGCFDSDHGAA